MAVSSPQDSKKYGRKTEGLVGGLLACLSSPPSCAGMQLLPERNLASNMGVSRNTVCRALDVLVKQGILSKRQGSGIFVRKVPQFTELQSPQNSGFSAIAPSILFAQPKKQTRLRAIPAKSLLKLGFWRDKKPVGESMIQVQRGIQDQAYKLGHRVYFHDFNPFGAQGETVANLLSQQNFAKYDGHLVLSILAPFFQQAAKIKPITSAFLWNAQCNLDLSPLVHIDEDRAHQEALRHLLASGCTRVAFLGYDDSDDFTPQTVLPNVGRCDVIHREILSKHGLSFAEAAFAKPDTASVSRAVNKLLSGDLPPDGLYVSDDIILCNAFPLLEKARLRPGKELAVITHCNYGIPLPKGVNWSRMEFNPYQLGVLALQNLVREIESAGEEMLSFAHIPHWIPGTTHLRS